MATITEDYVSFETAKLLREKGFDENTEHKIWYVIKQFSTGCHWNSCTYKVGGITREYDGNCCIPMPTLQMATKWLRKEHNIDISIIPLRSHKEYLPRIESDTISHDAIPCKEYEKAAEAAIKYCLENLI